MTLFRAMAALSFCALCVTKLSSCGTSSNNDPAPAPQWAWTQGSQPLDDAASELFSQRHVIPIHLRIGADKWRKLNRNAIELDDQHRFTEANVNIDGIEVGTVGVRPKGGQGTLRGCFNDLGEQVCDKLSYKLKFSEFEKGKRFIGLSRLNLHSAVRDKTFMHDYLAYGLFRRMAVDAPRVSYAELFVNDDSLGLYLMVEQVDKRFLESRFPSQARGNLYKGAWPSANLGTYYTDLLRTNTNNADHAALEQFSADLESTADAELPEVVAQWMDLENFDNFVAVDQAITNWDGPISFRVDPNDTARYRSYNFYLYQQSADRFVLIPWDLDHTFDRKHARYAAMPSARDLNVNCASNRILHSDAYNRDYLAPSCDPLIRGLALSSRQSGPLRLKQGPFSVEQLNATIEWNRQRLQETIARDASIDVDSWSKRVDELKLDIHFLAEQLTAKF